MNPFTGMYKHSLNKVRDGYELDQHKIGNSLYTSCLVLSRFCNSTMRFSGVTFSGDSNMNSACPKAGHISERPHKRE